MGGLPRGRGVDRLDGAIRVGAGRDRGSPDRPLEPPETALPGAAELVESLIAARLGNRGQEVEQHPQAVEVGHREAERLVSLEEAVRDLGPGRGDPGAEAARGRPP